MIQQNGPAPYAPPQAVLDVIKRYRDHGLSTPFTTDVLERAGVTPSLSPRTLQALKLLGLLDADGHPTEDMHGLEKSTSDEFGPLLAGVVKQAYADVFSFADPESDPYERIEDAFRTYTPKGQRVRMVTLFLGLCEAAGIKTPAGSKRRGGESKNQTVRLRPATMRETAQPIRPSRAPARRARASSEADLPAAVAGLLQSLPNSREGWTSDQRDKFLAAFASVLDFSYPIKDEAGGCPAGC